MHTYLCALNKKVEYLHRQCDCICYSKCKLAAAYNMSVATCAKKIVFHGKILNQVRASQCPVCTWFLRIVSVRTSVSVFVKPGARQPQAGAYLISYNRSCVDHWYACLSAPKAINN